MSGPWKDALTRSIGTEAEVEVDTFGPSPLPANAALVICSDGLYKTLRPTDILRIYRASGGPRGAAQSLVSTALEKGSDDNISVAIAEYGEVPRASGQGTVPLEYDPPPEEPEEGPTPGTADGAPEAGEAAESGDGAATPAAGSEAGVPVGTIVTVLVAVAAVAAVAALLLGG